MAEGAFFPAGLANSGNSCFWNALLQVLFAATPVFRGALFQLSMDSVEGEGASSREETRAILSLLRDLFAEMDMGLAEAIDARDLYYRVFQSADEADVSEQMQRIFRLLDEGPGPLRAVFRELFSGDLYEHLREGVRRMPLDLCQLDLCVTSPMSLERALEEHARDVQGSICRRSYRLPPVLWLNLDRFAYDVEAKRGRKRRVRLSFPEVLNTWMLMPPDVDWLKKLRECDSKRTELHAALERNQAELNEHSKEPGLERFATLVEEQETLHKQLADVQKAIEQEGAQQELLYQLEAVIVHRGWVDSGHYYAYVRPPSAVPGWCCLNDAKVEFCSHKEMLRVAEGDPGVDEGDSGVVDDPVNEMSQASPMEPGSAPESGQASGPAPQAVSRLQEDETDEAERAADETVSTSWVAPPEAPPSISASAVLGPIVRVRAAALASLGASDPEGWASLRKKRPFWSSVTAMWGCFPRVTNTDVDVEPEQPEPERPEAERPELAATQETPDLDCTATKVAECWGAAVVPLEEPATLAPEPPSEPRPEPVRSEPRSETAARCLIYVRRGAGGVNLLGEVRRRVPGALQEQIDVRNVELLRENTDAVVEDFVRCVRQLNNLEADECHSLEEVLNVAREIRTAGGMARARIYLLRACWQQRIPWLPEALSPTATPPDCRMHYGGAAKRMLLDALIKRGQHDVASLIVAETEGSDGFVPKEMAEWFEMQGL